MPSYCSPEINHSSSPKYLKIGVKTKGCSGNTYTFDFTSNITPYDEIVEQDGVKILVDNKALLSIIGSK